MIREIQTTERLNGEDEKYFVRRKILPAEIIIEQMGRVKTFRIRLPKSVRRVTGAMVVLDTMVQPVQGAPKWYLGKGHASGLLNSGFITSLDSGAFEDSLFQFHLTAEKGQWIYYAQPVRMNFFQVFDTGLKLIKTATIPVTDLETGFTEDYDVWVSDEGPGTVDITLEIGENK
ncbi:hypothetical protein JMN32_05350 [Fulvivirga sp. 29W222]|uniref:Uncharacterized protein n=1 Tax=Fulvivirga marina TaxID=2494733 RepID=A0A937FTS2_9BACT|nr:hypothetical protein [Fulvivirga marina]MBL6445724.1 hypothetical protein [Fulvivirga marina]